MQYSSLFTLPYLYELSKICMNKAGIIYLNSSCNSVLISSVLLFLYHTETAMLYPFCIFSGMGWGFHSSSPWSHIAGFHKQTSLGCKWGQCELPYQLSNLIPTCNTCCRLSVIDWCNKDYFVIDCCNTDDWRSYSSNFLQHHISCVLHALRI